MAGGLTPTDQRRTRPGVAQLGEEHTQDLGRKSWPCLGVDLSRSKTEENYFDHCQYSTSEQRKNSTVYGR